MSTRTASVLAYSGWWITGLLIWYVERRDMVARFHAAQSVVAFGAIALLTLALAVLSAAALSFLADMFMPLAVLTVIVFLFGVALWVVSAWKAASGDAWRIPGAAGVADRLASGIGTQESGISKPKALMPEP